MYRKKETEFQYAPGIEVILEDIIGGGTIGREGVKDIVDELPPLCIVGKNNKGLWLVLKTGRITGVVASGANYPIAKGHIFKVGDAVTLGGDLAKASDLITVIDTTPTDHDMLTLAATIGAAAKDDVIVLAKTKADAGEAQFFVEPEAITMNKVDTTVANQQSGLLARGSVNESVLPYPIDAGLKAKLGHIRFV